MNQEEFEFQVKNQFSKLLIDLSGKLLKDDLIYKLD